MILYALSYLCVEVCGFVSQSSSLVQIAFMMFSYLLLELSFVNTPPFCLATVVMAVVDLFRNTGVQSVTSRNAAYCLAVNLVVA